MIKGTMVGKWTATGVLALLLLWGCSPATQAVRRGDDLLEMKNYYGASQQYLYALRLEAGHTSAKRKLCLTAKQAYDQELGIAAAYEKASDYESALARYTELAAFIDQITAHDCLNSTTIDAKQKIREMETAASEKYYKDGEIYFNDGNYSNAITSYEKALKHNNPYRDCSDKIAESYYRLASKAEAQKSWREAAQNYARASETVSNYRNAADKATSLYYSLGLFFLKKGLCRNAYEDLNAASKIQDSFKDVREKMSEAEACSITKIAFVRFDNTTRHDVAGMSIGDLIFDDIKARLQNQASEFLRTMDRDELNSVIGEQKLGMTGITDDYATFKQLKGVHYLVFGKITQLRVEQPPERVEYLRTRGQQPITCTKQGRNGPYETTCGYNEITVNYTQHSAKLNVALTGSIKVVSVATGQQVVFQNISAKRNDNIAYADITTDIASGTSLPDSLWGLTKARREIKDSDDMIKDIVTEIDNEMVQKILQKIDNSATVSDPAELAVMR